MQPAIILQPASLKPNRKDAGNFKLQPNKEIKYNTKLFTATVSVSLPDLGGLPKRKRLEFRV